MANKKLAYLELPAVDVPVLKQFYGALFGWNFQDFGPDYAAFSDAGLEGGFNGSTEGRSKAPLAIIESDHIGEMERAVRAQGGVITLPIFALPGGRRFHFQDPSGNELAVMQPD